MTSFVIRHLICRGSVFLISWRESIVVANGTPNPDWSKDYRRDPASRAADDEMRTKVIDSFQSDRLHDQMERESD